MRCPWCGHTGDRVVDSRPADQGEAIRRRRECLSCGRRYTSYERVEELGLMVAKRDGSRELWDRQKMVAGIGKAIVNRPVSEEQVARMAERIESRLRRRGPEITSREVGLEDERQPIDHRETQLHPACDVLVEVLLAVAQAHLQQLQIIDQFGSS